VVRTVRPNAELFHFMKQLRSELAAEYTRIQSRVSEDPGTAGDQGEENWAELLRNWLPPPYQVVTRGRIIDHGGKPSPQVDVIVLHPSYPRHLLNKKYYLAGGVVAAFECKLTLKNMHLSKTFENCAKVKRLTESRPGTPYKELQQPIYFGLLAHSHNWKGTGGDLALKILDKLENHQFDGPNHPREMLDIVCIANAGTYVLTKNVYVGPNIPKEGGLELLNEYKAKEGIATCYSCSWEEDDKPYLGTNLGNLVADIITRFAHEDRSLQSIATYYHLSSLRSPGLARPHLWETKILSEDLVKRLRIEGTDDHQWSEWSRNL
jgi:hypothetical protein